MQIKKSVLAIFILVGQLSTTIESEAQDFRLEPGDLLFRGAVADQLSQAIDKVTQTNAGTHFSHVGIVEATGGTTTVLHASPEGGTCRVPLSRFIHPEGPRVEVIAYRLRKPWQHAIPEALIKAKKMLGKPYNFSYILTDTAYYCSDFIYRAFAHDSVFRLNPMTFKDPATGSFSPGWIDYYTKLGLEIPEGLPGCNPNGMAASEKLEKLGPVREKQ